MKYFTLLLALVISGPLWAQTEQPSKLSPLTRMILQGDERTSAQSKSANGRTFLSAFVTVKDDNGWQALTHAGSVIGTRTGLIGTARIPLDRIDSLISLPSIVHIAAGEPLQPLLDKTLKETRVTQLHQGHNLTMPYKGAGVVVGIIDEGLDLTHPTFRDSSGTTLRIVNVLDRTISTPTEYTTSADILAHEHSNDNETHGTHVAGIAAGSGYGTAYCGMAPAADICLVADNGSDNTTIPADVKHIFDYADAKGKPCVINMSFGAWNSPHDGTGYMDRMLDALTGKGHILVASAGNEGMKKGCVAYTQSTDTLQTFAHRIATASSGLVNIWADKAHAAFSVNVCLYNAHTHKLLKETGFRSASANLYSSISATVSGLTYSAILATQLDPNNNKYNAAVRLSYPTGADDSIVALIRLYSSETSVHAWCGGYILEFTRLGMGKAYADGTAECSINTPATAKNVIAVGAYAVTTSYTSESGTSYSVSSTVGMSGMALFSCLGPLTDGTVKPDVTAPGVCVVSAFNSFALASTSGSASYTPYVAKHTLYGGRNYPWGAMNGTSMSSPCVAGIIALWLQARPTLTPSGVRAIIAKTSTHNNFLLSYPNATWGYGAIDAYAGMKYLLSIPDGIRDVFASHPEQALSVYREGAALHLRWPTAPVSFLLEVTDAAGHLLLRQHIAGNTSTDYQLPFEYRGICFVHVTTARGCATRKVKF